MKSTLSWVVAALVVCVSMTHPSAAGRVTVTIGNGRVSIEAHAATLREILDTWAHAGQTVVVNADKIQTDAPLDLSLTDVTEEQALAVLLRPLSGYATTRRPAPATNVSRFDRIVLLPTSVASHDSAVINTSASALPVARPAPVALRPTPAQPPPQQTVIVNGVARLIGPNGALVEDDQAGAPPRPVPRPFPAGDSPGPPPPPFRNPPPPSTTAAPGVVGSSAPGVVISPPQRPNTQPVQR